MMMTRMMISARTPRSGHKGARWLRTLSTDFSSRLPYMLVALHWYSPGSRPMSRLEMWSSV